MNELTAINVVKQRDTVHLISDGAHYDAEQRLVSTGPKVFALPHINAAVGIRGPSIALPLLAHFIGHGAVTYDGLKSDIVSVLKHAFASTRTVLKQAALGAAFEVVIGGISERSGPDAYVISGSDKGSMSPITPITDLGFLPTTPEIDTLVERMAIDAWIKNPASYGLATALIEEIDPVDFGLQIIEMQRAAKFGGRDSCYIGGFAQLTTVRKSGIQTRVIRRWPDKIGRPLGEITSTAGVIGALSVKSLSIGDNAITVPFIQTLGGNILGTGSGQTMFSFNLSIDTTGLSGKAIFIYVDCYCTTIFSAVNIAHASAITINGVNVQGMSYVSGQWFCIAGSLRVTATGAVQTVPVTMTWNSPNTGQMVAGSSIFAIAAIR